MEKTSKLTPLDDDEPEELKDIYEDMTACDGGIVSPSYHLFWLTNHDWDVNCASQLSFGLLFMHSPDCVRYPNF